MATLELLEEAVNSFNGTILLISHDRTFMDNVVTSTWVFDTDEEGNGVVKEYVGGYQDYLVQKARETTKATNTPKAEKVEKKAVAETATTPKRKLSYKEQQELLNLPKEIEKLEAEQAPLNEKLADGSWFTTDLANATKASERVAEIDELLLEKMEQLEQLSR